MSCSPFTFLKVLLFFFNCLENSDFHILKVRSVFIVGNLENKVLSADSKGHRWMDIFSLPAFCPSSSHGVWTSPLQFRDCPFQGGFLKSEPSFKTSLPSAGHLHTPGSPVPGGGPVPMGLLLVGKWGLGPRAHQVPRHWAQVVWARCPHLTFLPHLIPWPMVLRWPPSTLPFASPWQPPLILAPRPHFLAQTLEPLEPAWDSQQCPRSPGRPPRPPGAWAPGHPSSPDLVHGHS